MSHTHSNTLNHNLPHQNKSFNNLNDFHSHGHRHNDPHRSMTDIEHTTNPALPQDKSRKGKTSFDN